MHLGNLVTIMAAVNFMKRGNTFYVMIGGATGMIGDPGGRDAERTFLDEALLRHNQDAIMQQIQNLLDNLKELSGQKFSFKVINNYDFYKDMSILEFLRKVGKFITVNTMIAKDIVKRRIEDPDKSISYTEFSYTLLQGYDFLKLYQEDGVKLQISGSDQRGNITTGTELIRKIADKEAYGFTVPLILDSNGKKFGKSAGNAVWIDANKNSPYFVYQFFVNTLDADVERFLKLFTLLDLEEIDLIIHKHKEEPELRYGQKTLANYVVTTLFGQKASEQAQKISHLFFGGKERMSLISQMSSEDLHALGRETGMASFDQKNAKLLDMCSVL
ncbi:MAG: tyrosine--tRNA ligase [bacterium]|nr:tyrosine--tRNA ligase [bacterium]